MADSGGQINPKGGPQLGLGVEPGEDPGAQISANGPPQTGVGVRFEAPLQVPKSAGRTQDGV